MAEKTDNSMLIVGILILVLLTAGLTYYITKTTAVLPPSSQTNTTSKPTITVSGEATRTVTPDVLSIGFTIQTSAVNTSDSEALNAAETAKVKAALLEAGLNKSEIHTQSYSTYPIYNQSCYSCYGVEAVKDYSGMASSISSYPPCGYTNCTVVGYQTTHSILITSGNTNEGGKYIDAALTSSNSTTVGYVYFSLKDQTRIQIESALQAEAAASAKTKAGNVASGLGATLGKIVSVNPSYYPFYPVYAYQNSAGSTKEAPPTEIFPTSTTLSSSITIVYELVQ
ncbi:SIMPL domain-containing protein [Candidatus Micrarchaeota archaeon]|nr:SIMPL domain-containing protein [Candidatus Micrarchaeota archaeon]